jgi:hypothetical protein
MIEFISNYITSSFIYSEIQTYGWFTCFPVHTVAHALGLSVFTSRLLATDLNIETSTSTHCEVFLLLRLQSLWNLGTKHSHSSSLRLTRDCPRTNSVIAFTFFTSTAQHGTLHRSHRSRRHRLRGSVFTEPLLRNRLHYPVVPPLLGADYIENTAHLFLGVGPCLQSCCLATRWSNLLHYYYYYYYYYFVLVSVGFYQISLFFGARSSVVAWVTML